MNTVLVMFAVGLAIVVIEAKRVREGDCPRCNGNSEFWPCDICGKVKQS